MAIIIQRVNRHATRIAKRLPLQPPLFKIPYRAFPFCPAPTRSRNNRSRIPHASTSTCNQACEKSGIARGYVCRGSRPFATSAIRSRITGRKTHKPGVIAGFYGHDRLAGKRGVFSSLATPAGKCAAARLDSTELRSWEGIYDREISLQGPGRGSMDLLRVKLDRERLRETAEKTTTEAISLWPVLPDHLWPVLGNHRGAAPSAHRLQLLIALQRPPRSEHWDSDNIRLDRLRHCSRKHRSGNCNWQR